MEFGVLGPVRVLSLDGAVDLGGARQRRLLAALIVQAGEVASTDRLLDVVFEGAPPTGASTTIRSYIARLRKALGDAEPGADHQLPVNTSVANFGFARDGQLLVISGFDGNVRVWDLDRGEPAGLVWDGTGLPDGFSPSWYDSSSDSIWVFTSGRLIEVPLDPQRWIERACDIVGRDLTTEEWNLYVPGTNDAGVLGRTPAPDGDPIPQSACT